MLVYIIYKNDKVEKIKDVENIEINSLLANLYRKEDVMQIKMSEISSIMVI